MSPTVPGGYPTTNTARLIVQYEGAMGKRSLMLRFAASFPQANAISRANTLMAAIKGLWHTSVRVTGGLWYPSGSVISSPVTLDPNAGASAAAFDQTDYPVFYSLVGRSIEGTRVRYFIFGIPGDVTQGDYRYTSGESPGLMAILAAFQTAAAVGDLVTAQGSPPTFNSYVNAGYNAYYQRQRRRVA